MKILCATDGSDDGYATVKIIAGLLDPQLVSKVKILIVTFPERETPLWDQAYELWLAADDLHRAMSIVTEKQLERLRAIFAQHATSIESEVTAGNPVHEILENAEQFGADLILLGITNIGHARSVNRVSSEVVSESPTPVVIGYGRAGARDAKRHDRMASVSTNP